MNTVIVGAGPAGLTAAYSLMERGESAIVFESDSVVGGIARTVERDGWRFDIGGHRFFTKVAAVEQLWFEMLPHEDWLRRPRSSHILYDGKFFEYPLRALDVLRNLGVRETMLCLGSYARCRISPPKDQTHFEGWVTARFGRRLYDKFFRSYTEKVWGIPGSSIRADWAAQRIKSLSLWEAVKDGLRLNRRSSNTDVTSLIAEFHYPRLGPGMLWERCRETIERAGIEVRLSTEVIGIRVERGVGAVEVCTRNHDAELETIGCRTLLSSMPLSQLVRAIQPPPPREVLDAADGLRYREFIVVALVVPETAAFTGQWIYIHTPGVQVGRIQNFGEWSPEMVNPGSACLGLEYFADEADEIWSADDESIIELAKNDVQRLGLVDRSQVRAAYVVRMPKAYPMYDATYRSNVETIRSWLSENAPNIHPVGRNGMHRYNNQDHSMLTAMLTVDNLIDERQHAVWDVNVDEDYHEELRVHRSNESEPGT